MGFKRVVILGSTGSIGINTLNVIGRFPGKFKVVGLTAYNNCTLLERQIRKYSPAYVAVNAKGGLYLKKHAGTRKTRILDVERDLDQLVTLRDVDIVVMAMRGSAALRPFLSAVGAGKTVATANKEALVVAGDLIMRTARRNRASIVPIDSEQSAIFQCLEGKSRNDLKKVFLTASGGPLLHVPKSRFDNLSERQILNHPRWKMGKKITVDSATLMNKGFEVIEAMALFQLDVGQIEVVVHPEAVIHSMAEFKDGSVVAQLSIPDMRLPIQYALTYPQRWESGLKRMNFFELGKLTFQKPDVRKFPALALAVRVGREGGTLPAVLNAADEEAVDAFLNKKVRFSDIYRIVGNVVRRHRTIRNPTLTGVLEVDRWAREEAKKIIFRERR